MLADTIAQQNKGKQYGVIRHNRNREKNIELLHEQLTTKTFRTSPYKLFKIYEPKERDVARLPYYPDRIVHHAIMNILEHVFMAMYTADTYSCIKGRGIHAAVRTLKRTLKDAPGTQYCLKLDIEKFYPNIDNEVLKAMLRRKIKDTDLLFLLDTIIDSAKGLPIGNYLSQHLANFYLTYFDHWLKEVKGVKHYLRYCDDLVLLSDNKPALHQLLADIREYLSSNLKLTVKGNYQVFPVQARGIDFIGYKFYHTHTLLRKTIKKNLLCELSGNPHPQAIASYLGWLKHCDSRHLIKKLQLNQAA